MSSLAIFSVVFIFCFSLVLAKKSTENGDMYLLAYSWQPEFCYGQTSYEGCDAPQDYWKTHFTLHGLWPQFQAGGYPADCTSEAFNSTVTETIGMDTMTQYWPNIKEAEGSSDYTSFWEHEWSKHGTCSGLTQTEYFTTAIDMIKQLGTPSIYSDAVGSSMSAGDIRDAFGGSTKATILCSGSYVTDVYTCWSRSSSTGAAGSQIVCPDDVQHEDTCTSTAEAANEDDMVNIASF